MLSWNAPHVGFFARLPPMKAMLQLVGGSESGQHLLDESPEEASSVEEVHAMAKGKTKAAKAMRRAAIMRAPRARFMPPASSRFAGDRADRV